MTMHGPANSNSPGVWPGAGVATLAWVLQGLSASVLVSLSCDEAMRKGHGPALPERMLVLLLSAAALAIAAGSGWASYRRWRALASESPDAGDPREQRVFLPFVGMLVGAVLTLGILWASLPAMILSGCELVR